MSKDIEGGRERLREMKEDEIKKRSQKDNFEALMRSRVDSIFLQILSRDETEFVRKLRKVEMTNIVKRIDQLESRFNKFEDSSSEEIISEGED